jgi:hypothetical protein
MSNKCNSIFLKHELSDEFFKAYIPADDAGVYWSCWDYRFRTYRTAIFTGLESVGKHDS